MIKFVWPNHFIFEMNMIPGPDRDLAIDALAFIDALLSFSKKDLNQSGYII